MHFGLKQLGHVALVLEVALDEVAGRRRLRPVDLDLRTQTSHLKGSTYRGYENVDHWIVLGHLRVSACDKPAVQDFIAEMKKKGDKAWTIRGCVTPLSRMFEYAVDRGWPAQNPVRAVDSKKMPKPDQQEMRILSSEEIVTYRLLFQVAISTRLRARSDPALQWEDVGLDKGGLVVRESSLARTGLVAVA